MLADRFEEALIELQEKAAEAQTARSERDDFIKIKYPEMNTGFSGMVDNVTGSHARLQVSKSTVIDTYSNHSFTTLSKTVVDIRSTLYDKIEEIRFTPSLESIATDQFGVISVATENMAVPAFSNGSSELFQSILNRGILMRGKDSSASLVVEKGNNFEELTDQLLEDFLAAMFIRT